MKNLLFLFAFITCLTASAQRPSGTPQMFNFDYYKFKGYVASDSGVMNAIRTPNFIPARAGMTIYNAADTSFYVWSGLSWHRITDASDISANYYNKTQIGSFFAGSTAISGYNKLQWDSTFRLATFDTSTRLLELTRAIGGGTTSLIIPRGGSVSGINALSYTRAGNMVNISGDNGSTVRLSVRDADSANAMLYSDTATMLTGYARSGQVVKYSDTASMLSNRLKISDTTTMMSGYARSGQVVKYSDTASMLSNRLKISDTTTMMSGYARNGQVVKYSDTALMLSNRLKISDTTTMMSGYARSGQVVKYSDTASMLLNRLKISDTTTMMSGYARSGQVVKYSDTVSMLSGYTRLTRFSDSLTAIRGRIDGTGTIITAAQPNITSVGILNSLTISGNVTISGNTASTSPTTGVLTLPNGGLGVSGDINTGGIVNGFNFSTSNNGTGVAYYKLFNTGGTSYFGRDNSAGNGFAIGGIPWATTVWANGDYPFDVYTNAVKRFSIAGNGLATFYRSVTVDSIIKAGGTASQILLANGGTISTSSFGPGTVTSVSVTTANGVSGSVANATTTPAISLTLGSITPTSVNSSGSITATTASFTGVIPSTSPTTGVLTLPNGGLGVSGDINTGGIVNGFNFSTSNNGTGAAYNKVQNTGGVSYFGRENSAGSSFSATPFATIIWANNNYPFEVYTNSTLRMQIAGTGGFSLKDSVNITTGNAKILGLNSTNVNGGYAGFYYNNSVYGYVGNGYNLLSGSITEFEVRAQTTLNLTAPTDVKLYSRDALALTLGASQTANFTSSVTATTLISNSGANNGVDAIQSGGGSILGNLFRFEAKQQNTSATLDRTATMWKDDSGSSITYTLPTGSNYAGSMYFIVKSSSGTLTVSGSIVTPAGSTVSSISLTNSTGMHMFYYNGTNWFQFN